jgi:integrase
MHEAAKGFIRDIRGGSPDRTAAKKLYHQTKFEAIAPFFKAVDVDAVDTPLLKKFVRWREDVKPITVAKDFSTLRLILRQAVEEGWISSIPVFPCLGKLDANPRPWLEPPEWADLQDYARERIEDAEDKPGKHRHPRRDLLHFMRLQVATCMRVDELRAVRVKDVAIRLSKRATVGGHTLPPDVVRHLKGSDVQLDSNEYLEIDLQKEKTAPRKVFTRRTMSGVDAFRSVVQRHGLKGNDLLFSSPLSDAFGNC